MQLSESIFQRKLF